MAMTHGIVCMRPIQGLERCQGLLYQQAYGLWSVLLKE